MKYKNLFERINLKLTFILILASFLRFYNYQDRWALAYDQAWFALIARHALNTFQIPLLGPFASGGPFQTGGEWFWIVMLGTMWAPQWVMAPWIFITFLSVFQVFLMYLLGKELIDEKFGLIVALLTAVSTSQSLQATNLTNQTTISLWSILLIWSIVKYLRNQKLKSLFLIGLSVGFASAQHLQGIMLVPVILVFVIWGKIFNIKKLFVIFLGFLVPWIPVLIADSQNNFYNTKSMIGYFSNDQSKTSYELLGRRWLTFILNYIPDSWARIIGGMNFVGYIEIFLLSIVSLFSLKHKKIIKEFYIIGISVIIILVLLRYIRTPLFENYITFLHPFVFLLVGFTIHTIFKKAKLLGLALILLISIFSIFETINEIKNSTNTASAKAQKMANIISDKYPNEKFAVYDYMYKSAGFSIPIVLYLEAKGKIDDNGRKIGYGQKNTKNFNELVQYQIIHGEDYGEQFFDLNASDAAQLKKTKWHSVTTKSIYDSVQSWYKIK